MEYGKKEYLFTVIIPIKTMENIDSILDNISNQNISFQDQIQIIIFCEKKYEDIERYDKLDNINIIYPNNTRQLGEIIKGKYIHINDSPIFYSNNTFNEVYTYFNDNKQDNVISLKKESNDTYNNLILCYPTVEINDLIKHPNNNLLDFNSIFIRFSSLDKYSDRIINDLNDLKIIIYKRILTDKKVVVFNDIKYYSSEFNIENLIQEKIELYHSIISIALSKKNKIPLFTQYSLINDINVIVNFLYCHEKESEVYFNRLSKILEYVSVKCILKNDYIKKNNRGKLLYLKNKNKNDLTIYDKKSILMKNNDYHFSIILAVNHQHEGLKDTVKSLINQSYNLDKLQIIIVSNNSDDKILNTLLTYQDKYPENIIVITKNAKNISALRNIGIGYIKGDYVNFIECGDILTENALEEVELFFEKYDDKTDICILRRLNMDETPAHKDLDYIFKLNDIINVNKQQNTPLVHLSSAFITFNSIKSMNLNTNLILSQETLLLNKILFKKKRYGIIKNANYYCKIRFNEIDFQDYPEFYIYHMKYFYENLINFCLDKEKRVPPFIQCTIIYDLIKLMNISNNYEFINAKDKYYFTNRLIHLLKYFEEHLIVKNRHTKKYHRSFLIYVKNKLQSDIYLTNEIIKDKDKIKENQTNFENKLMFKTHDYIMDILDNHKIILDSVKANNGILNIVGHIVSNFNFNNYDIHLIKFDENNAKTRYECKYVEYTQPDRIPITKFFGIEWIYDKNFVIDIPLEDLSNSSIKFEISYEDEKINHRYFSDVTFRLPSGLRYLHNFIKENKIFYFEEGTLYIKEYTNRLKLSFDLKDIKKIFNDKKEGYLEAIFYRFLNILIYPFFKNKRIWLFNDRPYAGDDNGKYLYRYALKQNDNVKKYYVIEDTCEDYKLMKKEFPNIISLRSFKHKLLYMLAEKKISPYINVSFHNPFVKPGTYDHRDFYSNRSMADMYFLQHGIIIADLTRSLKRYNINLSLFVTSSELERESIFNIKYNYPENIVKVLGLPRYDTLSNDNIKKQIIFMPTWRNQFKKNEIVFESSDFFKSLNNLFQNERLKELLFIYGYTFKLKPHPELIQYLDLFNIPDYIEISLNEDYQKLFNESALLLSDFSSVVFDFAYLKKPVIYYQPNDDYHYGEFYFEIESMGFGDVLKDENELMNKIEYYLKNDCKMEDEYKERVEKFFKYTDKNNCKRVYEWILNN